MGWRLWLAVRAPALALRWWRLSSAELGWLGEELAARQCRRWGYQIQGRRLRTRAGEIDILARDGACWVAIEVKTTLVSRVPTPRSLGKGGVRLVADTQARFRPEQNRRVQSALDELLRLEGFSQAPRRVDLIEVHLEPSQAPGYTLHREQRPKA